MKHTGARGCSKGGRMKSYTRAFALTLSLLCLLWSQLCLAQTGTALGFGDNSSGQIGDGTTTQRPLVTPALQISGVKAVACGYGFTLALDSNGTVWAWGDND